MKYSLNFKEMDKILKKHGYHYDGPEEVGGHYTEKTVIYHYENIDNKCKLELVKSQYNPELISYGTFINGDEKKEFYTPKEIEEVFSKLPFKKVYTYSVNSSNFWRIRAIYNYMIRKNISIFDNDVMDKLHERGGFRQLIDMINESYPNEPTLTKLAIFCKFSCLRSQCMRLGLMPFEKSEAENDPDYIAETRKVQLRNINRNVPEDHLTLHQLMIANYYSWRNAWTHLRALGRMFHPMIKIQKSDVILSERLTSLRTRNPDLESEERSVYNPKTRDWDKIMLKDVVPWLFKDKPKGD